jgi:hypothetical protein
MRNPTQASMALGDRQALSLLHLLQCPTQRLGHLSIPLPPRGPNRTLGARAASDLVEGQADFQQSLPGLSPQEQAGVVDALVERVDYDGAGHQPTVRLPVQLPHLFGRVRWFARACKGVRAAAGIGSGGPAAPVLLLHSVD